MAYRLKVSNEAGRSAGFSDPAYVAAGAAPPPVEGLRAEGTRQGILLGWQPVQAAGEVLLQRTELTERPLPPQTHGTSVRSGRAGSRRHPASRVRPGGAKTTRDEGVVWLQAEPGNASAARTVDATVREGVPYRYLAVRRVVAQAGGRELELRSAPSPPVDIAWRDTYAPPAPTGLTAVGFATPGAQAPAGYAVDLVWEPVVDPRVTGYVVQRVTLSVAGEPQGTPERLSPQPLTVPAFHDGTALRSGSYRYEVTAVDAKGNVSAPVTATVTAPGH